MKQALLPQSQRVPFSTRHAYNTSDESDAEEKSPIVNQLNTIQSSLEYKQMQMYLFNDKFVKADQLLSTILELNSLMDPTVNVFLMKQRYQILININPLQAEMCLMNILETIRKTISDEDELVQHFSADAVLQAETDLLLHLCNHTKNQSSFGKILS